MCVCVCVCVCDQLSCGFKSDSPSVICVHMDIHSGWRTCVGAPVGVGASACDHVFGCACARSPGAPVPHLRTCLKQTGIQTHGRGM